MLKPRNKIMFRSNRIMIWCPEEAVIMSKPAKTEAELIAMARAELKVHTDCPDGIAISPYRRLLGIPDRG